MKHKHASATAACLVATLGLALAGPALAQTTLTASTWVAPTHLLSKVLAEWCDDVAKATSSRVKCNILPKAVAAPPATFDAIRDGLADVSFGVHGYTPGRYPLTQVAELPFVGDSAEASSVAYHRVYQKHLAKAGENKGMKVLAMFTHGPGGIYNTKRPIRSSADAQGLKFRVGGGIVNEIGKALGMNVTVRPAPESYELLSTGVMDGVLFPPESIQAFKLEKIVRHRTDFPGGLYNTSFAFVMNEAAWNKLSKEDQAAIDKLSGEALARRVGRAWDAADRSGSAFMQANGVELTKADKAFIDEVRAKTAPLEQKWLADAKAKGIANPEQVLREFRAEVGKAQ
jgi:TRAP-type C4-dicarboxylate transport system substrate-binding protein